MRIGIYDPYLDDLGGGEKYMMSIASCLASENEVFVFWDSKEDLEAVAKRFSLNLDKVKLHTNIFSTTVSQWQRLKATHQFDVIIVLSDGSIPLTLSSKLFLHIQQPLEAIEPNSILSQFKRQRIAGVFYNSNFTKQYNKKLFPNIRDAILYPPVKLHNKKTSKENMIIHVGRYREIEGIKDDYKKQHFMVNTFKELINDGLKGWEFIIAAGVRKEDEESFDTLQKEATGYPIKFLINISNEKLFEIYHRSKIYWHASGFGEDLQKKPELAEHFGISTVEAMGSGSVPVVINAGGQTEIVTDGLSGLLWNSKAEFKEKTLKLIKNEKLRKKLSENAEKRALDFSAESFCKSLNTILQGNI